MRVLITAGPTREPIDPVRFLSNRSSGKMGFALAGAGEGRGHAVTLIAGPVSLPTPAGVRRIDVVTAADMFEAVMAELATCEVLVMAAAVADWRPIDPRPHKWKKAGAGDTAELRLERTRDILGAVASSPGSRYVVGFAAETERVLEQARRKRACKGMDMIIANDVGASDAGFAVDTNRVTVVTEDGETALPLLSKADVAQRIWDAVEARAPAR